MGAQREGVSTLPISRSVFAPPAVDDEAVARALAAAPTLSGRSKDVYVLGDSGLCAIRLVPTLTSFTFARHEVVPGTELLRLDFYDLAAERLSSRGVPTAYVRRLAGDLYLSRYCEAPPFEVIVKNAAYGSTLRKYPALFAEGQRFSRPVVKFDFRTEPEDQPIAEDYVRELGYDVGRMKALALDVDRVLGDWLAPLDLVDFCLIIGRDGDGYTVVSEISPDCMRLRTSSGESLDKDLFRMGASQEAIVGSWKRLVETLALRR
jgi:phosphoribosylaminoimidazole-succinocarboxamide synthase